MSLTLRSGASFILGMGLSLLPGFAPFVALLYFLTERWHFRRLDVIAVSGAVLFALPLLFTGGSASALPSLFQLLAAWLLFRSFASLTRLRSTLINPRLLGIGLLAGLATVVAIGFLRIEGVNVVARLWRAVVWEDSPALYAHTTLGLGALIGLIVLRQRYRLVSLGLSAVAILVSGSREAAIAWVVITSGMLLLSPALSLRRRITEWIVLASMLVVSAGIGSLLGWGNFGFLVDLAPSTESRNLLQGTEIGNGDWWFEQGVSYTSGTEIIEGVEHTTYLIRKSEPENWRRLQQFIPIAPGISYTASVLVRSDDPATRPGLQGWGELLGKGTLIISGVLVDGERWITQVTGPGRILDSGIDPGPGEWTRVWLTFEHHGEETLYWWMGLAPDQRNGHGSPSEFAAFQLEEAGMPSPYQPGPASAGLGLRTARMPYWQAAVAGISEKPILGWGTTRFDDYFSGIWTGRSRFDTVPQHTHNLVLQILFERGFLGLAGLTLFLATLLGLAFCKGDATFLLVAGGLLIANMFDYTLLYGGVLYPFAAIAGWRSAGRQEADRASMQTARQATVRLVLAAGDLVAVMLAVLAAAALRMLLGMESTWLAQLERLPSVALYALMLWPAAAWREGLYPGYGLTAPQELGKQVQAGVFAGLLLAVLSLFLPLGDVVPRSLLLATILLSLFIAPVGRALAKRLLLSFGLWGRPLVVLGAGDTGRRVVRALCRSPLDGLQPVALFDDDPTLAGSSVEGLRVAGVLDDAGAFAKRRGIDHAIVAIRTLSSQTATSLINTQGRSFRHMQFIPDLAGLPAEEVYASSLDGMLALEVRNGLYSRRNRLFKRAIDLAGMAVVGLIAAPVLLAIYLWVRIDSPGPGLYRSRRIGENGGRFHCLKFRTMYVDADERLAEIMANDASVRSEYLRYHKLERDPRVTRVGRLLRRFSLDELPQLYNVLVGEMSLVGPRPYMVREQNDMGRYGETILRAKPGITGYWQVTGRSNVTFLDRLEMESHYVRNWSIWWDIICLVKSFGAVIRRDGAV
jgi:Undecaprenyl-phosphate galactose phosphotransferase WbaP